MNDADPIQVRAPLRYFGRGQLPHLLLLALLVPGAWALAEPALDGTRWLGVEDRSWFAAAMAVPVIQQVLVVLFWRAQLCGGLVTRIFGDAGFTVWGVVFFPLLVARPVLTLAVGLADRGSLALSPAIAIPLGVLLLLPAVWVMHSVVKYFGFARALGGDHFFERYRAMPMVREGAFRYVSNGMYALGFLAFWALALLTGSQAALVVALFQHAYIHVHWYCTEQPDGFVLYGHSPDAR